MTIKEKIQGGIFIIFLGIVLISDILFAWSDNDWVQGLGLLVFLLFLFILWFTQRNKESKGHRFTPLRIAEIVLVPLVKGLIDYIWGEVVADWALAIFFIAIGLVLVMHGYYTWSKQQGIVVISTTEP